jgi:NodT family efflux transporter outer membrane factor (OMF) lipoprotein
LAAFAFVAASLTGCIASRNRIEIVPTLEVPESFTELDVSAGAAEVERWWEAFGDPQLDELVETALQQNLSLHAALLRVEQAGALIRTNRAGQLPTLDGEVGVNRARQFVPGPVGSFEQTFFTGSLTAAYEIDVWSRVRSGVRAAAQDAIALRSDAEAVAVTLAANVTEAWLDLRYQSSRRSLLERQIETIELYQELVTLRLANGLSTALEVYQQRQQLRALQSQLAPVVSAEGVARNRLAILLGTPPSAFEITVDQSTLPGPLLFPDTGVPADLLSRRPDVRAAEARAAAADWRVVTAVAERLPSLRLSGSISTQAPNIVDFFDGFFWRIAASAAAPLFDGGRRRAAVDRARLVREEALVNYGQALLTAMGEVEDALVQLLAQRTYMESLEIESENARLTLVSASEQYQQGVADYLRVLTAINTLLSVESTQLQAKRTYLSQQVALYRALGGDWVTTIERTPLEASEETPVDGEGDAT